jgi:hypothetical protein
LKRDHIFKSAKISALLVDLPILILYNIQLEKVRVYIGIRRIYLE